MTTCREAYEALRRDIADYVIIQFLEWMFAEYDGDPETDPKIQYPLVSVLQERYRKNTRCRRRSEACYVESGLLGLFPYSLNYLQLA
jgi:hypothetical protein